MKKKQLFKEFTADQGNSLPSDKLFPLIIFQSQHIDFIILINNKLSSEN